MDEINRIDVTVLRRETCASKSFSLLIFSEFSIYFININGIMNLSKYLLQNKGDNYE